MQFISGKHIARPYAEAAFRFAKAESKLPAWQKFLHAMSVLFSDVALQEAIKNPFVTQSHVVAVLVENTSVTPAQVNFLKLLAEYRRLGDLPAIAILFDTLQDKEAGLVRVHVTSAFPLEEATQRELVKKLQDKLKQEVLLSADIDPSLLGGIRVCIADRVLDASVKNALTQLYQDLR